MFHQCAGAVRVAYSGDIPRPVAEGRRMAMASSNWLALIMHNVTLKKGLPQ